MARLALSFSEGIRAIRGIERFLAVDAVISPTAVCSPDDDVCVVVWGRKKTAERALAYAEKYALPVLYLEDGFVRTCAQDPHSRLTYSLVVDRQGVYYDSSTESELESLLNADDAVFQETFGSVEIELSQACLEIMVDFNITKYNYVRDFKPTATGDTRPVVLVVDQTEGDASVSFGGMDKLRFQQMLDAAISENPTARVIVKTHPDVISGLRKGYLTDYAIKRGVEIMSEQVNPVSVLKTADHVYTGTSQMGMEALLCGIPVTVFGKPFYAGWGLTDDRTELPQRRAKRTLLELFFAAYMWYPRYCNPITGENHPQCGIAQLMDYQPVAQSDRALYTPRWLLHHSYLEPAIV